MGVAHKSDHFEAAHVGLAFYVNALGALVLASTWVGTARNTEGGTALPIPAVFFALLSRSPIFAKFGRSLAFLM